MKNKTAILLPQDGRYPKFEIHLLSDIGLSAVVCLAGRPKHLVKENLLVQGGLPSPVSRHRFHTPRAG